MKTVDIKAFKTNPAVLSQVKAFAGGDLSMGQLARSLDRSVSETTKLLNALGVPVLDYDLEDELDTLESLL